jgi:hypothetical protein
LFLHWATVYPGTFFLTQLFSDLGRTQPNVQSGCFEGRVSLTGGLSYGFDVCHQVGQMDFSRFSTSGEKVVITSKSTLKFTPALADRPPVPAQLCFGSTLTAFAQCFDYPGHKEPSVAPFERFGCFFENPFQCFGQFHQMGLLLSSLMSDFITFFGII